VKDEYKISILWFPIIKLWKYNSKNETCHANVKEQNTKSNPDRQQASVKYIRMRVYRNTGRYNSASET
jgi:hypothetical protein